MLIPADDLAQFTDDVWTSFLGVESKRLEDKECEDPFPSDGTKINGCVSITGSWEGTVMVEMEMKLATFVAATMFAMEPDEVTDEEIKDSVGEIANMIGGNVKGLVTGECGLSLPTVVIGCDYSVGIPGSYKSCAVAFSSQDCVFLITLLQKGESVPESAV